MQIKPEPNTVHHQMHAPDTNSDNDSASDDDSLKRRRDLLTRRPSYHRILKDITGPDIAGNYKCKQYRFSLIFLFFGWILLGRLSKLSIVLLIWSVFLPDTQQYFQHQRFKLLTYKVPMVYIRYKPVEVVEQSCNMRHKIRMDNFSYLVSFGIDTKHQLEVPVHFYKSLIELFHT